MNRSFLFLSVTLLANTVSGQENYYATALGKTGPELRQALHGIIRNHVVIPYSSSSFDTSDALKMLDEDPDNTNNVILLYAQRSQPKDTFAQVGGWNREHCWPNSYGLDDRHPAYSDLFNLRAEDENVNSSRGNKYYDVSMVSDANYRFPAHAEAPLSSTDTDSWEPPAHVKGDLARALFYMDVRYEGTFGEPDLILTEHQFEISSTTNFMGRLSALLAWHVADPASNHLTRRLHLATPKPGWRHSVPVFRFNMMQKSFEQIEHFLEGLHGKNARDLLETRESLENNRKLAYWQRQLYKDGILDPTYRELWVRGTFMPQTRDFGLITIGRNPFSDPKEPYVCIMVAGFHMFGTAHALGFLGKPERFNSHPFGGVIRVDMDITSPFAKRFDESTADWDGNSAYQKMDVVNGLKKLREEIGPEIRITQEEIDECIKFIESL